MNFTMDCVLEDINDDSYDENGDNKECLTERVGMRSNLEDSSSSIYMTISPKMAAEN